MSIYWIQTETDNAFEALEAVEQALTTGDTGTAPPGPAAAPTGDADPYLTENLAHLHQHWPVDMSEIVMSNRPGLSGLINLFQRVVRRLTWWYTLPQWQRVSGFHGALVRVVDVLLDRQRLLGTRIGAVEAANLPAHLFALEQQIQALRDEQRTLRRRIAELERAAGGEGDQT